jgi:hypothetical protein
MPAKHYDQFGRLVGFSRTPEEVAIADRENAEAAEATMELLWIFAPFSPFMFLGYTFGTYLGSHGLHPLFALAAGLATALAPILVLWKKSQLRKIYAWLLVPIATVIAFGVVGDKSDAVWGGFAALATAGLAGLYARHWSTSSHFDEW